MGFLKVDIRNIERYQFEEICRDNECKSASDVLDLVFGTYDDEYYSEYVLKRKYADKPKENIFHRVNLIWVIILYIIIAPFRFLMFGEARFSPDSKMGNILRFFIGTLK